MVTDDEVLAAVDDFLVVLREATARCKESTRRAQTIRRLRSHRRSYTEILNRVAGARHAGVTRANAERLIAVSDRLERAEVRALGREGVLVPEIAALCALTPARVDVLLAGSD